VATPIVAGGNMNTMLYGTSTTRMKIITSVAADSCGGTYVADSTNNRLLYFPAGSFRASCVYGQPDFASSDSNHGATTHSGDTLNSPQSVRLDAANNLYVADSFNQRVLRFPPGSTNATAVWGQTTLWHGISNCNALGLQHPADALPDSKG